jgi:hypothetical protein
VLGSSYCTADPRCDRLLSLLRDLELHGAPRFLLHDNRPCGHPVPATDVPHSELDQVAGAKLAVDGEIEQGEFPEALRQPKTYPDRPDFLQAQGRLLSYQLALVPGFEMSSKSAFGLIHGGFHAVKPPPALQFATSTLSDPLEPFPSGCFPAV